MFIITKQWLNDCSTEKGGYTGAQGKVFGFTKYRAGWKKLLIGCEISEDERLAFEAAASITATNKVSLLINKIANLTKDQQAIVKLWVRQNI